MQELNISYDYLSLVGPMRNAYNIYERPTTEDMEEIIDKLRNYCKFNEYDIYKEEYTRFGYKYLFKMGENINLYFYGPIDKNGFYTWRFEATGQGCRDLDDRDIDIKELIEYFKIEFLVHATRIDIAIDDFLGKCSFSWLLNKLENDYYLSSFKGDYERMGTKSEGYSIQFGSRNSTKILLIYEKNKERLQKGYELNIDYWTRFEMRFLRERAEDLANYIISDDFNLQKSAKGFLYDMLDIKIKEVKRGIEKHNVKTDRLWLDFLNNVEKCKLISQSKLESNLLKAQSWYKRSMTKLDTLLSVCNDDFNTNSLINSIIQKKENLIELVNEEKITNKELVKINSYRRKIGLEDFKSVKELITHIIKIYDETIGKLGEKNEI